MSWPLGVWWIWNRILGDLLVGGFFDVVFVVSECGIFGFAFFLKVKRYPGPSRFMLQKTWTLVDRWLKNLQQSVVG